MIKNLVPPVNMKITYVSDNRTGSNWGCRATSIALAQLLARNHTISETIYNDIKKKRICVKSLLPDLLVNRIYSRQKHNIFFRALVRIDSALGAKLDYVTYDPEESVHNLLKYMNKQPELMEIYEKVNRAEIVVINGEGDMIFNPERRTLFFLLMIIELAHQLKIPVFFVNAMVSDCPRAGRHPQTVEACIKALRKCRGVALRDPQSVALVKEIDPTINCTYIPDALFSWVRYCGEGRAMDIPYGDAILSYPTEKAFGCFDFSRPYICVGGSSLAASHTEAAGLAYQRLVEGLKKLGLPIYLVMACPMDTFLKRVSEETNTPLIPTEIPIIMGGTVLANSRLFVSGRYHPSILASLGGTPSILLGSNSHKTRSLQQVLNYEDIVEYPAIPTPDLVKEIINSAEAKLAAGIGLRRVISSRSEQLSKDCEKVISLINDSCSSAVETGLNLALNSPLSP